MCGMMVTKNGRNAGAKMAVFELEDLQGKVEVVMFPKKLEQFAELVQVDQVLFVRGKVDCQRETPNILCDELIPMEDMAEKFAARVSIELLTVNVSPATIEQIKNLCKTHRGKSPLHVNVQTTGGYRITTVADKAMNVRADVDFCTKMEKVVGRGNVKLMRN